MNPTLLTPRLLTGLERAIWVVGSVLLLAFGILGLRSVLDSRSAKQFTAESAAIESQLRHADDKPALPASTNVLPHGLETVRTLQQAVSRAAQANHVQLVEFRAGTQISPYIPRYQREMPEGDWSQMDARFTLTGTLREIMLTLRQLKTLDLPFEVDTLNMSRTSITSTGTAVLTAEVQLRTISSGAA